MPVMIMAAPGELTLVRGLAASLREQGGEVRCYLEEDDYDSRVLGCKIAVGELDDEYNISAALTNVHTFVPMLPDPAVINDATSLQWLAGFGRAAVEAAAKADVEQTIICVPPLTGFENELGRAYQVIRDEFERRVDPLCVLKTGFIFAPASPFATAMRGIDASRLGATRVPILSIEEYVALVAAVDDREKITGYWELASTVGASQLLTTGSVGSMSDWLFDAIASGLLVGKSASAEFGQVVH